MFSNFTRECETVHLLEQTDCGRWMTNRRWALLYPLHLMNPTELMAKSGRYRVETDGSWTPWGVTEYRMSIILPEATRDAASAVQLKRREYFGHPMTIDYRAYHRRAETKCYIMDTCHTVLDPQMPGSIVRKAYYDRIMRLYPDSLVYGCQPNSGFPILFMDYLEDSGMSTTRSIVGMIMPMNFGNIKADGDKYDEFEDRFDKWMPQDAEPTGGPNLMEEDNDN